MLLLAAVALAVTPHPILEIALPKTSNRSAVCPRISADVAGVEGRYDGEPLAPHKLTELPAAKMYIAVVRQDEKGCLSPIIVKYNIGR